MHARFISLIGEALAHQINLTHPLSIDIYVPSLESERSCVSVLGVSICPFSAILILDFGQCDIFCLSFYS